MNLRHINEKDQIHLKQIYFDSINSIEENIYNKSQKLAWCSQAWEDNKFNKILSDGKGWVIQENKILLGFAIRFPPQKLALLYVRGNSKRKGYGSILLDLVEKDVVSEGYKNIETEASLISYGLLIKRNWEVLRKEKIIIKDINFVRYKMIKKFS